MDETSRQASAADAGPPSGAPPEEGAPLEESASVAAPSPKKPGTKKRAKAEVPSDPRDRNRRIREEAAAKRRAKREAEERRAAPARNLDTSEIVDDALARTTHVLVGWIKRHFNTVQWVVVLSIVGGIGYQIYSYRRDRTMDRNTEELARALGVERGRVGPSNDPGPERYSGLMDPRREFASDADRLKAAEAEYRKAEAATSGTLSSMSTLGLAGVLYEQGKHAEAQAAYEKVKGSELARKDRDAHGRALEGIGLSLEAQGKLDPALQTFRELENTDIPGLKELGQYHQARLLIAQGERDKAKELLKKLVEKTAKPDDPESAQPGRPDFLESQSRELLASIDPTAVTRPAPGLTPEQLERLKAQLKLQGNGKLDAANLEEVLRQLEVPGGAPPSPAPAGDAPPSPAAPAPLEPEAPGSQP